MNKHLYFIFLFLCIISSCFPGIGEDLFALQAAKAGKFEFVKKYIELGGNPNLCDSKKDTFLHKALRVRDRKTVKFLVDKNANILLKNCNGETPLSLAVESGCLFIIKHHINHWGSSNICDDKNDTLLHKAVRNKRVVSANFLIEYGADVFSMNNSGETPLSLVFTLDKSGKKQLPHTSILNKKAFRILLVLIEEINKQIIEAVDNNYDNVLDALIEKNILNLKDVCNVDTLMLYNIVNRNKNYAKYRNKNYAPDGEPDPFTRILKSSMAIYEYDRLIEYFETPD